jgi:Flp pilus assembly protein TadG
MGRLLGRASGASSEDGAALVEFALILPILVVLLFGMLEFGKAFNYWIDETHLANEGARWAVVDKDRKSVV